MTAALIARSGGGSSGLRPVNARQDMHAIADVIEAAFSGALDDDGVRMLRWMKRLGRAGWIGWLLSLYFLPPAARPMGFVWESDGRVVGNASLLPVEGCQGRWVMANVAVHPTYQRQGIARELVRACVGYVRDRKGQTLLLQVEGESQGAQHLYASQGFRPLTTRATWITRVDASRLKDIERGQVRERRREEWRLQWDLARRVHPEGVVWPYPPMERLFRPRGLADVVRLDSARHWVWAKEGKLLASLTARWGLDVGAWRLILIVDPQAHNQVEAALLACGMEALAARRERVVLDYPSGVAETSIEALGFIKKRTLTWMSCDLQA